MKNYYDILGVAKTATQDEIKSAYRKLAKKYHPDKNGGDSSVEEKFKEVADAYENIGTEEKRKKYDAAQRQSDGFGHYDFGNFTDYSFGSRSVPTTESLTIIVEEQATIAELMEGRKFKIKYEALHPTSSSKIQKDIEVLVDLSINSYPISFERNSHWLVLKVRGAGSSQNYSSTDFFGRPNRGIISGDLVIRIKIDTLGLQFDQSDIIQNVEVGLYDLLFGEELILEGKFGKKYRIKSFGSGNLNDIKVRIAGQGLVSAFGNKGNYIFNLIVKKPKLENLSQEKIDLLKDLLIGIDK